MSNLTDLAPRRIPEWLSLPDISRAWNEETGEDAATFEKAFLAWFNNVLMLTVHLLSEVKVTPK